MLLAQDGDATEAQHTILWTAQGRGMARPICGHGIAT